MCLLSPTAMEDDSPLFTPEAAAPLPKSNNKRPREEEQERAAEPPLARTDSCLDREPTFGASPSAEKYRKIKQVGKGAYGSVFMAENEETKEIVAIKTAFRKQDPILGGFPLSLLREISILRSVKHDNIVQIHEIAQTVSGDPLIVMEFCQASLLELISSNKHDLSFSEIKYIIRQILDAMDHLHQKGILHRDLATKNVLFNLSGDIKVCDFGISRVAFGQDESLGYVCARDLENPNQIVSLPYRSIELLLGDPKYGPALDIWAVGCILAEVLLCQTGRRQPFFGGNPDSPNKNPQMMVEEIFQILGRPSDLTWPGFNKLPLIRSYGSARISGAKQHRDTGEERFFVKKFFLTGEGVAANTKYCLSEGFFDLLGSLLTLCPAHRVKASDALQHTFFTKEKPLPEWHAWHWDLAKVEIPRGDKMKKRGSDDGKNSRALLKQLSKDELNEEGGAGPNKEAILEKWRAEADKKKADLERERARKEQRDKKTNGSNGQEVKLPPGWTKHWSSSKQRHYYHDKKTGQCVWQVPVK